MKTYVIPEYVVLNRNNQKDIVFQTKSLETAEKVKDILSKFFPDEYKGNSFFIHPATFNSELAEAMFEHQVVESYRHIGKVDLSLE